MTSQEILKASMLDILFENRNKQYGAYALRKFYGNRMAMALAISLSSVLLVCFLVISSSKSSNALNNDDGGVVVTTVILPPPPEAALPELPAAKPAARIQSASVNNTDPEIVPDILVNENLPTTDEIADRVISNANVEGVPNNAQHTPTQQPTGNDDNAVQHTATEATVFDPIEKQPEFPGGVEAWRNFLSRYLQAPDELAAGERRTVQVRFIVNSSGQVTDFEIIQSAGSSFDREVMRVLKKMPKWTPAIQNGQEIAVSFVQPVTFQGVEE